jgi:hypothetical protein
MPFESRSLRDTHAIGKSPSLLWARTWQKQGRIQFIRRPIRVNPAGVVNAAAAVRTRISRTKCPMRLQKSLSYSRKRISGRLRRVGSIALFGNTGRFAGARHRKARLAGPMTGVAIPARAPSGPNWMCPKGRHDCPKDLERDLEKRLVRDRAMRRLHRRRNRWRCPTGPMAVAVELDP